MRPRRRSGSARKPRREAAAAATGKRAGMTSTLQSSVDASCLSLPSLIASEKASERLLAAFRACRNSCGLRSRSEEVDDARSNQGELVSRIRRLSSKGFQNNDETSFFFYSFLRFCPAPPPRPPRPPRPLPSLPPPRSPSLERLAQESGAGSRGGATEGGSRCSPSSSHDSHPFSTS